MIKKYLTIIFLLPVLCLNAQDFIEHPIDEVIGDVRSVKLNDLDNDGNLDIIATINGQEPLIVYFGEGNGDFESRIALEDQSSSPARDINFLDINNDNILDIICIISDELVYYLNNGDRTFGNKELIAFSDPQITSFDIADFDDNGLDDLIVRDIMSDIVYYPNMGNETLGDAITIIQTNVRDIIAQDFNGDESIDFLTGAGIPQLFINNNDGTFTLNNSLDSYPSPQFTTRLHTADVNSDDTVDLLFAHTNFGDNNGILWYANESNGNFTLQAPITSSTIASNLVYRIVRTADFNNDGNTDIIAGISDSSGNGIPLWVNDGNENFGEPLLIDSENDSIDALEIYDFNNDGKMDFIIGSNTGAISWFENNMTLSVEDNSINTVSITPNPSEGLYTITTNQNNQLYTIQVYNALGQIVTTIQDSNTIDLSAQPSGIYIAKIEDPSGTPITSKKLIKL